MSMLRKVLIYGIPLALLGVLLLLFLALFGFPSRAATQSSGTPITGYLWSDNIGWVSLNCSNTNSCGTSNYGLSVATDGTVSGYAWSDNIGWVSANAGDVTGCPTAPCTPAILTSSNGALSGWLKALSGGSSQSGGWDGWISLAGSGYGPVLGTNGSFSGYAWGSTVVGWTSFAYAQTTFKPCTPNSNVCLNSTTLRHYNNDCTISDSVCPYASYGYICSVGACQVPPSPGGNITAIPRLVRAGNTTQVIWNVTNANANSCSVTGSNGDTWLHLASSGASGKTSSSINTHTVYVLHCDGMIPGFSYDAQATVDIAPTFKEK